MTTRVQAKSVVLVVLLAIASDARLAVGQAQPSNDAAAFKTFSLYADRSGAAGTTDHVNLYPVSLSDTAYLVLHTVGSVTDTVALLNLQPNDATGMEVNGATPASYAEFAVIPPRLTTSVAVSVNAYLVFAGFDQFYDFLKPLTTVTVTYEDNSTWAATLNVEQHVRNFVQSNVNCGSTVIFPATSLPYDPLVVQLYASGGYYLDMQELRLPRVPKKVSKIRVEAISLDHFCSTFVPHIYAGCRLYAVSLWPRFDLQSRTGAGIVPQYQSGQSYSGDDYGGYKDPVTGAIVGSYHTVGGYGCFLADLATALTYVGTPISVPALNAAMQMDQGFEPEAVCKIVAVSGQAVGDTVTISPPPGLPSLAISNWSDFVVNRTSENYSGALATFTVVDSAHALILTHPDLGLPIAPGQQGWVYRGVNVDKVARLATATSTTKLGFDYFGPSHSPAQAVESAMIDSLPSLLFVGESKTNPHWVLSAGWRPAFVSAHAARGTYGIANPIDLTGLSSLFASYANRFVGAWVGRLLPGSEPQAGPFAATGVQTEPATVTLWQTGNAHLQFTGSGGEVLTYDSVTDDYSTNIPGAIAVRQAQPGNSTAPASDNVPADLIVLPVSGPTTYALTATASAAGAMALSATYRDGLGSARGVAVSATLSNGGRGYFGMTVDPAAPNPVALTLNSTVGVLEEATPSSLRMRIAPNPSAGSSRIAFNLPFGGKSRIDIYDVSGRRVRTLTDGVLAAGSYVEVWDGRGDVGTLMRAGLYFVRLQAAGETIVARCLRLDSRSE
ncbi:MAG: T9SS type A sorting domain-containing protein [Candidatus Eisenbacteria bacterium]|nr:T9SS type A sorting domain-containing protein [Candidatus Eisenbacteria bacterium]